MLHKVYALLDEMESDIEEGIRLQKCALNDMNSVQRVQYYQEREENLEKLKNCKIRSKIEKLRDEAAQAYKELSFTDLKICEIPHIINSDGGITYYLIVDTLIEKIIYKGKIYYIPKAQRDLRVFGTVTVTLDKRRNYITRLHGNLKGYIHQHPRGSCLCTGSLQLESFIKRKITIEMFLQELQKQFVVANLDSAYYAKNSRIYREIKTTIGRKMLKARKKITVYDGKLESKWDNDDD